MTMASVTQICAGDLEGPAAAQWLQTYGEDGRARFVGLELVEEAIDTERGALVAEEAGEFDCLSAAGERSCQGLRNGSRFTRQPARMRRRNAGERVG